MLMLASINLYRSMALAFGIILIVAPSSSAKKMSTLPNDFLGVWYTTNSGNLESNSGGEFLDESQAPVLCAELKKNSKFVHSFEGIVKISGTRLFYWDGITKLTDINSADGAMTAHWKSGENKGVIVLQIRDWNSAQILEKTTVFESGGSIVDKYDRRCE
jgi:hypothetical protein